MKKQSPEFIKENYPIVSARFHSQGIELIRGADACQKRPRGKRDYITELSASSLNRLAFTSQNLRVKFSSMLTLTCGTIYPREGRLFKKALNRTLSAMRYRYKPLEYLWFLEFQVRGAPHVHLMLNVSEPSQEDRDWLAPRWAKSLISFAVLFDKWEPGELRLAEEKLVRQHKREKTWTRIRDEKGAAKYVMKYATKTEQKKVPKDFAKVGSFWAVSKNARPKPLSTNGANEELMRIYLRNRNHAVAEWPVLPKLVWFTEPPETAKIGP